jgi:tRNA threonylcarbamoyladenosine biosynthesis protein TsaE
MATQGCGAALKGPKRGAVNSSQTLVLTLRDEGATGALAAILAARAQRGDVIGLSGPLGAGKTCFARAFVAARSGTGEVPSPTFTLVEVYDSLTGPAVWHFDLYRLEKPEDVYELGFEDALAEGISLIEWPERLGGLLPAEHLTVSLTPGIAETERRAELHLSPSWAARIQEPPRG